ncbi:unnamed protein product, partial [Aureobasidium pullulans]
TRLGPCSLNCLLAMISIRHWEFRSWQASHSSFLVNGSASFSTNLEGYFGVFGCFFAISVFAFFSIMPLLFSYGFFPIAFSIFPRQKGCIVVAFWGRAFAGKSMGQNRDQSGGAIYRFFKLLGQGREKHRTIHIRHYLPISQTQRIAFRDKTSNLILLVALPSKLYLLVPAPHSVWSS